MSNPTTYPDTFPAKEITSVVTYLRGGGGDLKTTLFDAYVVEGYVLGVTVGNPPAVKGAFQTAALERKDAADKLEAWAHSHDGSGRMALIPLPPWLLPLVIQIIMEIVQKLLGG